MSGRRHGARCDGERAQRLRRERLVAPGELGPALLAERHGLAVLEDMAAVPEQDLRCALGEGAQLAGVVRIAMDRGVPLALRREGSFRHARETRELRFGQAELAGREHEHPFRRVALHAPAVFAVRQR
jgi:hypothetical protein